MLVGKQANKVYQSYTKPCKRCENLFNPTSRYNKICDHCKEKAYQWRDRK